MLPRSITPPADTLAEVLRLHGHEVSVAVTGTDALACFERLRPTVAILDIGLPDMSGFDVARAIRSRHPDWKGKLVALTGYGQPEDERRAREAGFDAHLVKPAEFVKLRALLRSAARAAA